MPNNWAVFTTLRKHTHMHIQTHIHEITSKGKKFVNLNKCGEEYVWGFQEGEGSISNLKIKLKIIFRKARKRRRKEENKRMA